MGFLGKLFGASAGRKRQNKTRGPGRSAAERYKLEELRFLRRLERDRPDIYDQMMMQKIGLPKGQDPLETFEAMYSRLKKLGAFKGGGDDSSDDLLKSVMTMIVGGMQSIQGQGGAPVVETPAQRIPPAQTSQIATPEREVLQIGGAVHMSLISRYVIANLNGKTPAEAAAWLRSQQQQGAKDFITTLCNTPDEQIIQTLEGIAQGQSDFAGVVVWLRERPEWVVDVVRALRATN